MEILSTFHKIPYWGHLQINRILDAMHIYKNMGASISAHLVGDNDTLEALEDLRVMDKVSDLESHDWHKIL